MSRHINVKLPNSLFNRVKNISLFDDKSLTQVVIELLLLGLPNYVSDKSGFKKR